MRKSGFSATIRRLNETAHLDLTEWFKSRDWLGHHEKDINALEARLRDVWNLGRNVILRWAQLPDSIQVLAVPQYLIAGNPDNASTRSMIEHDRAVRDLLASNKQVDIDQLETAAALFRYPTININVGTRTWRLSQNLTNEIIKQFGINYVEDQAVALFDIVGFSLYSPLEQAAQLNSLSYSLNSAHARMLTRERDTSFARSTTGDGFYVWNKDSSIAANINLYHFMHLALADNALARSKAVGNVTPQLRAAFHVSSHYEFYQSEGLHPTSAYFIVGDVTIELARMVEQAKSGQVLVGDFLAPMTNQQTGRTERVGTERFIELTQNTLTSLEGLVLSQERIEAIHCYLTGDRTPDGFVIRKRAIIDKHGLSRNVYNAKINIYRKNSDPIFLGLQEFDIADS